MGDFEPDAFINEEDAGFKQFKVFDIGDIVTVKDRVSLLDSCSRFGNIFVGRQNGFDLYRQADMETNDNPNPVSLYLKWGNILQGPSNCAFKKRNVIFYVLLNFKFFNKNSITP
jgi:hypothetical protein